MAEISTLNGYKIKDKKAIRYYDTIADMVTDTTLKNGMHAKTKGYYTINDGGGADYHITDTQSVSDHQEELSNNLYATLLINNKVTPEMFGAKGDGITDDSQAIQNAINYSNGLVIFNNNNSYLVSNTIYLKSNIELSGQNSTIIMDNAGDIFNIDNTSNVKIHDFNVVNSASSNTDIFITTNRPTTNYCYNISIYNIKYNNTYTLVNPSQALIFIGNVYNLDIHNCNLKGNAENSMRGIMVWSTQKINDEVVNTKSEYIRIYNNTIDGFYRNIESYGTSTTSLYGSRYYMIIENNNVLNATDTGIYAYHGQESMIKNNYIIDCKYGCWSDNGINVDGNYFNHGEIGLWTEEFTNGNISNNSFNRLTNSGIIIGGGTLVSNINDNSFRYCQNAITIDEQYTPNTYYSGNLNIQCNKFTSIYNNILFLKYATYEINFNNNYINVWGLESTDPVYAIAFDQRNLSGWLFINNNTFDNNSFVNGQPSSTGNCNGVLNTNGYSARGVSLNNNIIKGAMSYLATIKVSQYLYVINNIFETPTTGLLTLSSKQYSKKYVIKGNINLEGSDTLTDETGGTTLQ